MLDDVLETADDTQLTCALGWGHDLGASPWPGRRLASPRIERIVRAVARNRRPHSLSAPERRGERESAERECVLLAAIEAKLISGPTEWEATLLAIAADLLQAQDFPLPVRRATRRCLARLGSPRAFAWARANVDRDGEAGAAAISLIADLAEPADARWLCDLLTEALTHDNIYAQCDLVDGLARLRHVAAAGIIDEVFDGTVYSYLRTRCAAASALLAPDFAERRAIECLDDCEPETRALGVAHARDRISEVRERIRGMAEDPMEEDRNRRAAAARITQWR